MSIKTIPKQTIVTCDFCGDTDKHALQFKMKASVNFKGHCLDMYGDPACDASFSLDLCDSCARDVVRYLKERKQ